MMAEDACLSMMASQTIASSLCCLLLPSASEHVLFFQIGNLNMLTHLHCRALGMHCSIAHCPPGKRQLFTEKSIKAGHYLLFFFAAVSVRVWLLTCKLWCLQRASQASMFVKPQIQEVGTQSASLPATQPLGVQLFHSKSSPGLYKNKHLRQMHDIYRTRLANILRSRCFQNNAALMIG